MSDRLVWLDNTHLEVDGVDFACLEGEEDPAEPGLYLCKSRRHTEAYADLLSDFEGADIVELGIHDGGSAALLTLLARPRRLVALDIKSVPSERLTRFLDGQGRHEQVRAYYGVDQGDRTRLRRIVDEEFGDRRLDLVIDDASHLLAPTRASFETLFPLVRPGGLYCIEDWNWQHQVAQEIDEAVDDPGRRATIEADLGRLIDGADAPARLEFARRLASLISQPGSPARIEFEELLADRMAGPDEEAANRARAAHQVLEDVSLPADGLRAAITDVLLRLDGDPGGTPAGEPVHTSLHLHDPTDSAGTDPLVSLVMELVLLRARSAHFVASVEVGEHWIRVRRGPADLDPDTFRLDDLVIDDYGLIAR